MISVKINTNYTLKKYSIQKHLSQASMQNRVLEKKMQVLVAQTNISFRR